MHVCDAYVECEQLKMTIFVYPYTEISMEMYGCKRYTIYHWMTQYVLESNA